MRKDDFESMIGNRVVLESIPLQYINTFAIWDTM